jgi:transcriptional regulator with XRE-family HTH domain
MHEVLMSRKKITNDLFILRRERGLSRKQVSALLGYKCASSVRRLEEGKSKPTLDVALRLEILYRRPVAYLYSDYYTELREQVRHHEARLPQPRRANA